MSIRQLCLFTFAALSLTALALPGTAARADDVILPGGVGVHVDNPDEHRWERHREHCEHLEQEEHELRARLAAAQYHEEREHIEHRLHEIHDDREDQCRR